MMRKVQGQNLPKPARKGRRTAVSVAGVALFVLALAVAPHILFHRGAEPSDGPADAILVLAGGENRIAEGFRAWRRGLGRELFILGAGRETTPSRILPDERRMPASDRARIHIEGWSANTLENAFSARAVIDDRGYRKVVLVTSDYHMPRAYLALRCILPRWVAISVIPVRSDWRRPGAWHRLPRLFLVEGWKYWGYRVLLRWE